MSLFEGEVLRDIYEEEWIRGARERANLTPREHQVLGLMADGFTRPQIAETLVLGVETVKTMMARIYLKLHAKNAAHAVAIAVRKSLV